MLSQPRPLLDINRYKKQYVHDVCVCVFWRETSDEGEGDPTTTFATGARYLGFSTFHIAGQFLVPSDGHFMLLVNVKAFAVV